MASFEKNGEHWTPILPFLSSAGILYDLVHIPPEVNEKCEEMLEHIIELDDLRNGWARADFSMSEKALEEAGRTCKLQAIRREELSKARCSGRSLPVIITLITGNRLTLALGTFQEEPLDVHVDMDEHGHSRKNLGFKNQSVS